MKNIITLIFILFINSLSVFTKSPAIIFNFDDGTSKSYNIADIENITFPKSLSSYVLQIYRKDTLIISYNYHYIDSMKVKSDNNGIETLIIYPQSGIIGKYPLWYILCSCRR